ncbi:MerR family transcriptional regulator [Paraburkholderia mimosarum]|uniref:MerR family transcriptional regulator n=1 Tax=Paraburkholderia mimosarum TaxID=312026 RepID=UPI0003F85AB1|nr:MerR family transcriptional regulator [Paraburkholderia mimosarum]
MTLHRITDVARLTGTNVSTLRLWEQHGLVSPKRSPVGQRVFDQADIEKIRAIQHMRKVEGLNMSAIRKALAEKGFNTAAIAQQSEAQNADSVNDNGLTGLGSRFRLARNKAGMSLRGAAEASGLPVSFISTFERTSQGATVASMQALALCYGTTVTDLSRPSSRGPHRDVVRRGSERSVAGFGKNIRILQLAESLDLLDCQKWVLQPGAESSGFYSHEGEEFIHVLSGTFQISVDDVQHILGPGDSIAFASQRPHSWKAIGDEPTVLVWVNTPKSF